MSARFDDGSDSSTPSPKFARNAPPHAPPHSGVEQSKISPEVLHPKPQKSTPDPFRVGWSPPHFELLHPTVGWTRRPYFWFSFNLTLNLALESDLLRIGFGFEFVSCLTNLDFGPSVYQSQHPFVSDLSVAFSTGNTGGSAPTIVLKE